MEQGTRHGTVSPCAAVEDHQINRSVIGAIGRGGNTDTFFPYSFLLSITFLYRLLSIAERCIHSETGITSPFQGRIDGFPLLILFVPTGAGHSFFIHIHHFLKQAIKRRFTNHVFCGQFVEPLFRGSLHQEEGGFFLHYSPQNNSSSTSIWHVWTAWWAVFYFAAQPQPISLVS